MQVITEDVRIPSGEIDARLPLRYLPVGRTGTVTPVAAARGARSREALGRENGALVAPAGWRLQHPAARVTVSDWGLNVGQLVDDFGDHVALVERQPPAFVNHVWGIELFEPYLGDIELTERRDARDLVRREELIEALVASVDDGHRAVHDIDSDAFDALTPPWAYVIPDDVRPEALAADDRGWLAAVGALEAQRAEVSALQWATTTERHHAYAVRGAAASIDPNVAVTATLGREPSDIRSFVWQRAAGRVMFHCERFDLTPAEFAAHSRVVPAPERDAFEALRSGLEHAQRSLGLPRLLVPGKMSTAPPTDHTIAR